MIEKDEIESFWRKQSKDDLETAEALFSLGKYVPALFFCHLSIEKLIKALVVRQTNDNAPLGHNLIRLAELADVKFSEADLDILTEINTFNIKGRYSDYKTQFYDIATKDYTVKYINETKRIILWLQKQ